MVIPDLLVVEQVADYLVIQVVKQAAVADLEELKLQDIHLDKEVQQVQTTVAAAEAAAGLEDMVGLNVRVTGAAEAAVAHLILVELLMVPQLLVAILAMVVPK